MCADKAWVGGATHKSNVCWRMLNTDVCWRIWTYADVCWRMQVQDTSLRWRWLPSSSLPPHDTHTPPSLLLHDKYPTPTPVSSSLFYSFSRASKEDAYGTWVSARKSDPRRSKSRSLSLNDTNWGRTATNWSSSSTWSSWNARVLRRGEAEGERTQLTHSRTHVTHARTQVIYIYIWMPRKKVTTAN
jgi:hypothetical protein